MKQSGDRGISYFRRKKAEIQGMNLTSDLFSSVAFEDVLAVQDVLRILTGIRDLCVGQVIPQKSHRNLYGHGVVLDVWAEDMAGRQYNIEIQMSEQEDHLRRSRFIQSLVDSRVLQSGEAYDMLPELYLIFITEKDFLSLHTGIGKVVRHVEGTDEKADNGVHEIYANLEYPAAEDGINRLLRFIQNSDEEISTEGFENLANRVYFLKKDLGGMEYMCTTLEKEWRELRKMALEEGLEEGRKQGRKEGREKGIREGIQEGIREGIQEGIQEGHAEELIKIILNMQKMGLQVNEMANLLAEEPAGVQQILLSIEKAGTEDVKVIYQYMVSGGKAYRPT